MRYPGSHRGLEYQFAAMMVAWGSWLLLFPHSFHNPIFQPLEDLAPEPVWGVWSVSIGSVRLAALYINGNWRRTPVLRIACSILGLIWWGTLIFLYLTGSRENLTPSFSWLFVFLYFECVACQRSAADAFHAGSFKRLKRTARNGPG